MHFLPSLFPFYSLLLASRFVPFYFIWQRRQRPARLMYCIVVTSLTGIAAYAHQKYNHVFTTLEEWSRKRKKKTKKKTIFFCKTSDKHPLHALNDFEHCTHVNSVYSTMCILHSAFFDKKESNPTEEWKWRQKHNKKRTRLCITMPCTYTKPSNNSIDSDSINCKNCDESTVKYVRRWFEMEWNKRMKTNTKYYIITKRMHIKTGH